MRLPSGLRRPPAPACTPCGARRRAAVTALCLALAGCSLHWPWKGRTPQPPQPVRELSIRMLPPGDPGFTARITQFWDRNTLLLDLTQLAGAGAVELRAGAAGWPVRVEFRVQPGAIAVLEMRGIERNLFQVPAAGAPLLLQPPPGAYARAGEPLTLRWSAAGDSER
jgi:hypothetical protein